MALKTSKSKQHYKVKRKYSGGGGVLLFNFCCSGSLSKAKELVDMDGGDGHHLGRVECHWTVLLTWSAGSSSCGGKTKLRFLSLRHYVIYVESFVIYMLLL